MRTVVWVGFFQLDWKELTEKIWNDNGGIVRFHYTMGEACLRPPAQATRVVNHVIITHEET